MTDPASNKKTSPCCGGAPAPTVCCSGDPKTVVGEITPCEWFGQMIPNCLKYAQRAKDEGRPVIGIMCEFTPRELIMAAGGVPVCLCGGSADTIPAAERDLPANLCPLIKSTYGFHVEKSNPFLEMADLIVAETTCDGKKKMYELLAETRPVYILELPQKVDDKDALEHWRTELRKFRDYLEVTFNVEVTDDKLREATATMNRERELRRELASLMTADHPPLTGRRLLSLKSSISGIDADLQQYEKALELLKEEAKPCCGEESEPVRVLMTGVPMAHGSERVLDIIEDGGGLVVAMENCTGLKPIMEDVDVTTPDITTAIADKYFHLPCSVMTSNDRRLELLRELVATYRPQCVIDLVWQACLTYDVESHRVKKFCEEELGLPYLRIETDYSPHDSARIAVRVEALFETLSDAS
jgi:benzoyl-CoA reductase/2-hydroxyglutaryl-CoA dehydratase subunit BcrC/BadD/HgdB